VAERRPGSLAMMEAVHPPGRMVRGLLTPTMAAVPPMAVEIVHQLGLQVRRPQHMARLTLSMLARKLQAIVVTTPGAQKHPLTSHNHNQTAMVVGDNKHLKVTAGGQMRLMPRLLAQLYLRQRLLG